MINYWPNTSGMNLNNAVANLFITTNKKIKKNLYNKTYRNLYIDILDNINKYKLLTIVTKELETILLDIIECNLNTNHIKQLQYQILLNIINKSCLNFLKNIQKDYNNSIYISQNFKNISTKQIKILESNLLIEPLLTYLIFGSNYININRNIFLFPKDRTPIKHVIILFENFIIQASNLVIYIIFNYLKSLHNITLFLQTNNLCNSNYISTRSIALLINQLSWENYLNLYIYKPKAIYSSRYQVWLLSSKGIITKYIYLLRLNELSTIPKINFIILFCIEILDTIIPKIETLLFSISKYFIYILMYFLGNTILLIIRGILIYLNY